MSKEWKVIEQIDGSFWIVGDGKQIAHCHANSYKENRDNAYDIVNAHNIKDRLTQQTMLESDEINLFKRDY